ncbi:MAG: PQQ-binding-like beta-propeller repeat protein [Acidobacteria bacterium]|nr:PQQ-binding-like beta-propeller repeat protein [Acidobacteriota bacterium]
MSRARLAGLLLLAAPVFLSGQQPPADQWPGYGQTNANQNFSPLTQITPVNVGTLQRAWTFHYGAGRSELGDMGLDYRFEVTPLHIGGVLYISTPSSPRVPDLASTITALEPENGKVLWKYDSPRNIHGRGLAYWKGDGTTGPRFFFGTRGGYLEALDVRSGKPAVGFGEDGKVDAYAGVASAKVGESRRATWTLPNPVSIYKNLIVTGSRPGEVGPPGPRGDIRAWDARTGKLVWTVHTVPTPGEPGFDTWERYNWQDRSGANVWSTMAIDEERGLLFAPLGDINGRTAGRNLYASTLMAIDLNTGQMKWFHQLTVQDQWDYDLPTPPVLLDVRTGGKVIPAVAQSTKQGLLFIFDRVTGQPVFGIEDRPTPRSDDPGETAWPTQPFPVKPPPIARNSMTRDEIAKITPEMEKFCTEFWDTNKVQNFGPYTRPRTDTGTIIFPGTLGGSNWGGPSFNPQLGLFFVNVMNVGNYRPAGPLANNVFGGGPPRPVGPPAGGPGAGAAPGAAPAQAAPGGAPAGPPATGVRPPRGFAFALDAQTSLPCSAPPWGEMVAVNVNSGEIAWRVPLGITEALGDKGLTTGTRNLGGSIATASGLVFIGATNDRRFRAFDARSGKVLFTAELDASGHSTPISYLGKDGKQYVVIAGAGGTAVGSRRMSDELVAFALP